MLRELQGDLGWPRPLNVGRSHVHVRPIGPVQGASGAVGRLAAAEAAK